MAFQGIDLRQTGDKIIARVSLKDDAGDAVVSGTTEIRLAELQSDGTLKTYDFDDDTFKSGAVTDDEATMTHRQMVNSTLDTGIWTYVFSTLSGFTAGNIYIIVVTNTGATPPQQEREFQFGVASVFDPFDSVTTSAISTALSTVDTVVDGIQTDLDNGTDGLGALKSLIDVVDGVADGIKAKTDSLTFSVAGNVDANLKYIDDDNTPAANLKSVGNAYTTAKGFSGTDLAAIKAVTDALPDAGALTSIATAAALTTVDTEVGQVKAVTDQMVFTVASQLDVNALAISGDATAADNLEATYDGSGYTDGFAPATQDQVSAIANISLGGFPVVPEADNTGGALKSISFVGVETSGTFASTEAEDGTYHQIDDTGNAIDIVYQFDMDGARLGTEIVFKGYLTGVINEITVQAYDYVGPDWETRGTIGGQAGSANISQTFGLLSKHTGVSGADANKCLIRFVCTGQSNPTLQVDELIVSAVPLSNSVGYALGSFWLDTINGTAGTVAYVNAVADLPSDSLADVLTLAASVPLSRLQVANGSTVTLAATLSGWTLSGDAYTVALGGQNINTTTISDAAVSGVSSGKSSKFFRCKIGAASIDATEFHDCAFTSTLTLVGTGDYLFNNCESQVAGSGSPTVDLGALGATTISFRRWSGGLTLANIAAGDVISVDAISGGTITLTGVDGDVQVRGMVNIVDSRTGSPTLGTTNNMDTRLDAIDSAVATVDTEVGQIKAVTDVLPDAGALTTIDTEVGQIKAVTDLLPDAGALSSIATATALATVDTVVDGIQTDLSNGTDGLGAIKTAVDAIGTDTTSKYMGAIWFDATNGAAGSTLGTNGTPSNPCSSESDVRTLLTSSKFRKVMYMQGTYTLGDTYTAIDFWSRGGGSATLAFNSQVLSNCSMHFVGVSGTTGVSNLRMHSGRIGTSYFNGSIYAYDCTVIGTISFGTPGSAYVFQDCYPTNADTATIFDFVASATKHTAKLYNWQGPATIRTMTANSVLWISGSGEVTLEASCTGGVVRYGPGIKITNNGSGNTVTPWDDTLTTIDTVVDGIQTDLSNGTDGLGALKTLIDTVDVVVDGIQTDLDNGTDGLGALKALIDTLDTVADSNASALTDIQSRIPAALASGLMKVDVLALNGSTAAAIRQGLAAGTMVPFTVDTVTNGHSPTPTEFQADDITEATADHFNGRVVLWTSGTLLNSVTDVTDYAAVGGIGQFTVTAMTEAPANNDTGILI